MPGFIIDMADETLDDIGFVFILEVSELRPGHRDAETGNRRL
jgi:hypothetical protein